MKTIGEVLQLSADYLQKRSIDRARRQVEEILSYVLKIPRIELYMQFDRPLMEEELVQIRQWLKRRSEGEPVQYISGEVEFLDCKISVNRDVLIPRPETEILVDKVIKEMAEKPLEVWDICTGSGCIGIAIQKKRGDCRVVLADISLKALETARANATLNGVDIEIVQGDLLAPFEGRRADVIICNPPYVSESDYVQLDREVREWEPRGALVAGPTGFEFYQRLAKDLPRYLNPGAKVYFEIGRGMGEGIKNLFGVGCETPFGAKSALFEQDPNSAQIVYSKSNMPICAECGPAQKSSNLASKASFATNSPGPFWKRQELLQDWSSHDRYYKLEIE